MNFDLASANSLVTILSALVGAAGAVFAMRSQISELARRLDGAEGAIKNLSAVVSSLDSSMLELENKILRELMDAERRHEEKFVTLAESAASLADMRRRLETLELIARK